MDEHETDGPPPRRRVFDTIIDRGLDLSGLFIWLLAIGIFVNVLVRRFGIGLDLSWMFETTEYLLLVIAFLGGAALLRDRGHVTVDLVGEVMWRRGRWVVTRIGDVLTLAIVTVMTFVSGLVTYRNAGTGQVTPGVVEIPRWWIYAVMPIGFAFLTVQAVRNLRQPISGDLAEDTDVDPSEQYPV